MHNIINITSTITIISMQCVCTLKIVLQVLVMAGQLKRENPDIQEDLVLIRALRDSNLPKFLADDATLFKVIS